MKKQRKVMEKMKAIEWIDDHIRLIDQRKLPKELVYIDCYDVETLGEAIKSLAVRGAPALGIAGAMGLALASLKAKGNNTKEIISHLEKAKQYLASTRPTAVNLFWAMDRVMNLAKNFKGSVKELRKALIQEALTIAKEDEEMCKAIGDYGASIVQDGWNILHYCNTGFLATGDYGTALGVIRSAHRQGKNIHVWVCETRPLLQGARLTAWELSQDKIPYTLITDNMAGYLMQQGKVDMVVLGADRITAQGDVANKIGTYTLAVLSKYHNIPFYSAAPFSTVDLTIEKGEEIKIEERNPNEIIFFRGVQIAPKNSPVYNPAFDVTPHHLITGIITEKGIAYPPFEESLKRLSKHKVGVYGKK